ncbi:GAF and ANTAR domain-containing protein [Haloactinomyces albus]|uniref:Transcriptional regulator with GAF, ATPase, and Fis domain n=1 Tax=Haloactinomyces albus TaxID=1352928 RepID=A0AAE3ZCR0_9ACTN|nr:GAF and ANTAR domain-containing protein [Haloactinomyces albus]MDR7301430.1 transcriptional regulator with GAF, ATPase, and Fis domain [Haloactinomyces albus]
MSTPTDYEELATRLAHMARDLLQQKSVQDTLDRIVEYAVQLIEGCSDAGILVLRKRQQVETLATTSDRVRESDRAQGEEAEGPCFDAANGGAHIYRIADLSESQQRWPRYAPRVRELGYGSMMGFLLFTEQDNLGALNLYAPQPSAFTERSEQAGWILASHAAIALSSARTEADLHTAISTRQEIGEALGIVMERHKLSESQAFDKIRKASQDNNTKLREIAHHIIHTGETPGAS